MADSHHVRWQQAIVEDVRDVAQNIRRIVLRPARANPVKPGEHIDVRVLIEGQLHIRSYSIVDAASDGSLVALSVFLTSTSRGGSEFMHSIRAGDTLEVTEPLQNFPLRVGAPRYVLLAGGIGITAIAGMASLLQRLGADYRIIYTARSRSAMAYEKELRAAHGDRLETHVNDEGQTLDVPSLIGSLPDHVELYMCGPIRLMDAVRRAWIDRDLDPTNLRFETFGNSGWFDAEPFTVRVPELDIETVVNSDETMLEALERVGVDTMFDCRRGECGLCQVKILELSGQVDHRDIFYSDRQKAPNTKMCCCVSRAVAHSSTAASPTGHAVVTIETP